MSEQQRIMLAIGLCVVIFAVAQILTPPPVKRPAPEPLPAHAIEPQEPGGPDTARAGEELPRAGDDSSGTPRPVPHGVAAETSRSIDTELFHVKVADHDARLVVLDLRKYKRQLTSEEEEWEDAGETVVPGKVSLTYAVGNEPPYQAKLAWSIDGQDNVRPMAFSPAAEGSILAFGHDRGVDYSVEISASDKPYALEYTLRLTNDSQQSKAVAASMNFLVTQNVEDSGSMFFGTPPQILRGYCNDAEGNLEAAEYSDLEDEPAEVYRNPVSFAGVDAHYFVAGLLADAQQVGTQCRISTPAENAIEVDYGVLAETLAPGQSFSRSFMLFTGPKRSVDMQAVDERLATLTNFDFIGIPMGFVGRPMIALLNLFHDWVGSWGVAIILLTLFIKLALFPLTFRGQVAMRKMQAFKPELDAIKKRFPDDPERQRQEQVRLFREKGYNPLGGCMPMLLQMPILIALYSSLRTTVELYQQPFLWLPDLTLQEPGFPTLALGLSALYFGQQFLTPMQTDNPQAQMMRWIIPIFIPVIMIVQPSGLLVYLLVSSAFTSAQQLIINRASPLPEKPKVIEDKSTKKLRQGGGASQSKKKTKNKGSTAKAGAR